MLNAPVSFVLFISLFKKEMTIAELEKTARTLRLNIIIMIRVGQKGHLRSCDDCFILQAL
jgi:hypothetical protein